MAEQRAFAGIAWSTKGRSDSTRAVSCRDGHHDSLEAVDLAQRAHYPKAGRGRQPLGLDKILRVYFVQQWFDLSDPAAEDAICDTESIRRFVGIELGADVVPDESSILRLRHLSGFGSPMQRSPEWRPGCWRV